MKLRRNNKGNRGGRIVGTLMVVAFVGLIAFGFKTIYDMQLDTEWVNITVSKTDALASPSDGHVRYMVYTEEGETFTVEDSWPNGVWNSSDTYGRLNIGQRYRVKVNWFRNHFFSQYRNILQANRIDD